MSNLNRVYVNNYTTTLAAGLATDAAENTIVSLSDDGALKAALTSVADSFCVLTMQSGNVIEVIAVILRDGNVILQRRALEGTAEQNWTAGSRVICAATATSFTDVLAAIKEYVDSLRSGGGGNTGGGIEEFPPP